VGAGVARSLRVQRYQFARERTAMFGFGIVGLIILIIVILWLLGYIG
jgi:uncharacterized membrane protein YqiK